MNSLACVLTVGKFDGVHKGHLEVLSKALSLDKNLKKGVVTFEQPPLGILYPNRNYYTLTNNDQKFALLKNLGFDFVTFLPVNKEFLSISHDNFAHMLKENFMAKHIVIGKDFRFGKNALGNVDFLKNFSKDLIIHTVSCGLFAEEKISSSRIKEALLKGDFLSAASMLGRDFSITGRVIKGQNLGATLGFRTANFAITTNYPLTYGVYATITKINNKYFKSISNFGIRPTISNTCEVFLETHILEQNLELYGCCIEVFFISKIREEIKFSSQSALIIQIKKDILIRKNILS